MSNLQQDNEKLVFDFTIKLNERNKPISCEFYGKKTPIETVDADGTRDFIETLSLSWVNNKIRLCEASPNFTKTSTFLSATLGQVGDLRWIILLFSKTRTRGISKTKTTITIENYGNDPHTYGNFIGETDVNISFE